MIILKLLNFHLTLILIILKTLRIIYLIFYLNYIEIKLLYNTNTYVKDCNKFPQRAIYINNFKLK